MISRLHYISQETDDKSHLDNIKEACQSGIDGVQLPAKDRALAEISEMAFEAKTICNK